MELPTPYRDAAHTYRAAGWVGVLPTPYRTKKLQLSGWTGHGGAWPSAADIQAWCETSKRDEGGGNIALRLPRDIVGIDVDAYAGKSGGDTLAEAMDRWGPLPDTWITTARDDGISGIRLYRVPEGLRWPGQVGPGIETIHTGHRYAMVWPSLHPEGRVYRWYRPDGLASTVPPRVDEIPDMPEAWLTGLTGGELAETVTFADVTDGQASGWFATHGAGHPCRATAHARDRLLSDLAAGSAHESLRHLMTMVRFAEQGHPGLLEALGVARTAFMAEATRLGRSGARSQDDAAREWRRSLTGALSRILGDPSVAEAEQPDDPCNQPFAGLVAPTSHADAVPLVVTPPAAPPPAPGPTGDGAAPTAEPVSEEHTSWWPRDLAAVLSGENAEPPPAVLARADKQALFYAGKVNGLLGESESGKTWVALLAVAQALTAGQDVLYLDFEDAAAGITGRLTALGVPMETQLAHLVYIDPDESLHVLAAADLAAVTSSRTFAIITIDGVNAAMSLLGLELESNSDATRFAQTLLRPLARTGAAVITIDHVAKNKETRGKGGIGAQAKRAMVTGCSISVEVVAPFGRGQSGRLRLTVDKDRGGHVRGIAQFGKNLGTAVMESDATGASVTVVIEPPDERPTEQRAPFRPTGVMASISRLLSTTEGDLSGKQIEESISGRASVIRAALDCLVNEGFVTRHPGPRNAVLHRHTRTYRELQDLVAADDDEH